eukprot:UN22327
MKWIQRSTTNFKISECLHHVLGGGSSFARPCEDMDHFSKRMETPLPKKSHIIHKKIK